MKSSLKSEFPNLAAQWHPTKNGDLSPNQISSKSDKKVWWLYPYDDPETGLHYDFVWKASIYSRTNDGCRCPYLSGRAVWPGFNDLATKLPELAKEWDYENNGSLTPQSVTVNSSRKVSWIYPYDDPATGKHFNFRWKAKISSRTKNQSSCPYLSGKSVWVGFNDLATRAPDLAKEWDYENNGALTPQSVTIYSQKKVSWYYPYDDPETGKHFDFRWKSSVAVRSKTRSCPFLYNRLLWPGFNDLATKYPELAKEWDYENNGPLTPQTVIANSTRKVSWVYPYDDPVTGKHFVFRWKVAICYRVKGYGCPYLKGNAVWPGFNDLATKYPDLAKEWDYENNGTLTPQNVLPSSNRQVNWIYYYDDPDTGKHFVFRWKEAIYSRSHNTACPYLSGQFVWPGFNDLATKRPDLAKEWDYENNGTLTPRDVSTGSGRTVSWICHYDDSHTGKHFVFRWKATIVSRTRGKVCPYLSGKSVWRGFNDLATQYPELAKEWDYEKNGSLTPQSVLSSSERKVFWVCQYDDPHTGKHFVFRWKAAICSRTRGEVCPFLSGKSIWPGFNDLATKYPDLAKEWDYEKNGALTPQDVSPGSSRRVYWIYHYDDPDTGKHFVFKWNTPIVVRSTLGSGCPYLAGKAVWPGFNDLATKYPELAKEWDYENNGSLTPQDVSPGTNRKVSRIYHYDDPDTGKHFAFRWKAVINSRSSGVGCPYLSGKAVWPGFNDFATKYPELAKEWDYENNGSLTPQSVLAGSTRRVNWIYHYDDHNTGKHFVFRWKATLRNRSSGIGCPYLSGSSVWPGFNDLQTGFPDIANEWHPTMNKKSPSTVYKYSVQKYAWICPICGNTYFTSICNRTAKGTGCPKHKNHK